MKDFLGKEIKIGDKILTFSQYHGSSARFYVARVIRTTNNRVYLEAEGRPDGNYFRELEFTVPNKCVVLCRKRCKKEFA